MHKSRISNAEFFRVALHEAGHILAGQVRGGTLHRPAARAAIFPDGGGCASVEGLSIKPELLFKYAVYAAAGKAAEKLAEIYKPPRRKLKPPTPREIISKTRLDEKISSHIKKSLSANFDDLKPDPEVVKDYCTQFNFEDPKDWAHRYERVTITAQELVHRHREEIRAVAVKLYHDGAWYDPGTPDPMKTHNTDLMPPDLDGNHKPQNEVNSK